MEMTPLERWIAGKIPAGDGTFRERIERYQLQKLREALVYVREKSPFYRQHFASLGNSGIEDLQAFTDLPFTTAADLKRDGLRMLCTSQDEIERVVTLQSSGTTGPPKRLFFTEEDLAATIDFFAHGMGTLVEHGGTVIIFLPGSTRDSVGDLLARALAATGVKAVVWGPVRDAQAARSEILKHSNPCLVGIPTQILALARGDVTNTIPPGWVASVLLSTDYVPQAIQLELERLWGCRVLTHYGMTETGLGGGVECKAGEGYHLREADLYTEIVDPVTGAPSPLGEEGEVVFTTLTRRGMPLVRYRTGDRARFLPHPCPCGSQLKRLGRVQGRIEAEVPLKENRRLTMAALNEALFPIPGVLDFTARVVTLDERDQLHLCLHAVAGEEEKVARRALPALFKGKTTGALFKDKALALASITFSPAGWAGTGVEKRRILDLREKLPAA